jgi:glycosyltransferase involved in cell wall biosynthesis
VRKCYNIAPDKKLVVFLGRLLPQKGVDILISAFKMMSEDLQEKNHLLIAGDGEYKEYYQNLAKNLRLHNVTFTGAVQPSVRGNFFEQCDVFVYPVTYYKGWVDVWGLTINEAIQHGKIVIATDAVGSAYDLIESGVNGFRIEPGNAEALKDALVKALTGDLDESTRKKDKEVMEIFSYKNMANCYLSFIDDTFNEFP